MIKNKNIIITKHPLNPIKNLLDKYLLYPQRAKQKRLPIRYYHCFFCLPTEPNNNVFTKDIHFSFRQLKMFSFLLISTMLSVATQTQAFTIDTPIEEGSLIQGHAAPDDKLFIGQTQIPIHPSGSFYFGLPQDAHTPLQIKVITKEKQSTYSYPILSRKWAEQRINGLAPSKVQINSKNQKRIQAENAQLRKQRTIITKDSFPVCFTRPLKTTYRISGAFGNRRVFNNVIPVGHSGTDYAASQGTPVYAIANGTVVLTHEDMFLSGKTILINHGYGIFTSYSHLSEINVREGQKVTQGDFVGKIGATGRATGPHLHFTLTWLTTRVDPERVFETFSCEN